MNKQHRKKETMKTQTNPVQAVTRLTGLLFLALFLNSSCTKEIDNWIDVKDETITDTVTSLSDARIITYNVATSLEEGIYASVNNQSKEITVYLPWFYAYNYIEPTITLPQGTTISPVATELVPVFGETPFTYTVIAKNGETAEYTVKPVVQQPELTVEELSTADAIKVVDFTQAAIWFQINGSNFIPSGSVTKLYVIDAEGKDIYNIPYYSGDKTFTLRYMAEKEAAQTAGVKADTDYWLELRSYSLSKRMQYPIRFSNI